MFNEKACIKRSSVLTRRMFRCEIKRSAEEAVEGRAETTREMNRRRKTVLALTHWLQAQ